MEESAVTDAATGAPALPRVRYVQQATLGDLVWHNAELVRRSPFILVLGAFVTFAAGLTVVLGDPTGIFGVLLGLSFLTGLFGVPFVWWSVRRRRDLLLAAVTVELDGEGVTITQSNATVHNAWSVYRRARETKRAFLLDTGAGHVAILLKRAMAPDDVAVVRGLLTRLGLLGPPPTLIGRLRPLLWIGVGIAAVGVLIGGTHFLATPASNVAIDATPTVVGRHVSLDGTTDLPDGTVLGIQILQLDAWRRADAAGEDARRDFDLVELSQATVRDGRFHADAEMSGWPPGHGMAAIYFWIDDSQPDAVKTRFGRDGAGLHGPGVYKGDTGPTLRVDRPFDIPE